MGFRKEWGFISPWSQAAGVESQGSAVRVFGFSCQILSSMMWCGLTGEEEMPSHANRLERDANPIQVSTFLPPALSLPSSLTLLTFLTSDSSDHLPDILFHVSNQYDDNHSLFSSSSFSVPLIPLSSYLSPASDSIHLYNSLLICFWDEMLWFLSQTLWDQPCHHWLIELHLNAHL